jgi:hypothetical protein
VTTRTLTIAQNNDDMYWYTGGEGGCWNDDTVLLGGILGDACHASFRFLNFPVAGRGVVLTSAKLYLHCALAAAPTQTVHIQADKAVNPTLIPGSSCNPTVRTLTTTVVDWALPTVDVNVHFYSPSFHAVLQEVIDQPTFQIGNAVLIAVLGHSGGGDVNGIQVASYEAPGDPVQLVLEWHNRCQGGML